MSIFSKFQAMADKRSELNSIGIDPFDIKVQQMNSPTEGIIQGRKTILAGTNNYLGLTFDDDCIKAASDALTYEGTGTTGSRMANGSYSAHRNLEMELATFYNKRDCIVFSTGYLANLGLISTLTGPKDTIILDSDCHASIYDGCRLGGAKTLRFRHNSPDDLAKRMERLGEKASEALIVVEGIYSMLGDHALLKEIIEVKKQYGGYLLVDEAHSLGVLGKHGRGLVEELDVADDVDFIVGTFSKSMASAGGYCVSNHKELDLIRYTSRPYIFTASPSPATIATARYTLQKVYEGQDLRKRLHKNAEQLRSGLKALGYNLGTDVYESPIIAVIFEDKLQTLMFWDNLLKLGVYTNLMIPPATPNGSFLIRCSVSAAHTTEQIDAICHAFATLKDSMSLTEEALVCAS